MQRATAKIKSQEPNPAFEGTRGYALACFLGVRPPAPLNLGVGHVEERSRARRAAGSTAILGCDSAEGKASVCTTWFFGLWL